MKEGKEVGAQLGNEEGPVEGAWIGGCGVLGCERFEVG